MDTDGIFLPVLLTEQPVERTELVFSVLPVLGKHLQVKRFFILTISDPSLHVHPEITQIAETVRGLVLLRCRHLRIICLIGDPLLRQISQSRSRFRTIRTPEKNVIVSSMTRCET